MGTPADPQILEQDSRVFRTAGLPDADRICMWEEHNAAYLIGLRCRTLDSAPFDAAEVQAALGEVRLARVTGSPHLVERSADDIRRSPSESVALYLALAGEAFFHHDGGTLILRPGQIVACDADRPFFRGFSHGLDELVARVPRSALVDVLGTDVVDLRTPRVLADTSTPHGAALRDVITRVTATAADTRDGSADADERMIIGVVSALLGRDRDDVPSSAHLLAIRAFVQRHLDDPSLTAPRIAAGVGLSERHLSRVMASADLSVPTYVLGRRLDHARRLLEDPSSAPLTLGEIAARSGFSSSAHFSRTFARRFGQSPSEARRAALARV